MQIVFSCPFNIQRYKLSKVLTILLTNLSATTLTTTKSTTEVTNTPAMWTSPAFLDESWDRELGRKVRVESMTNSWNGKNSKIANYSHIYDLDSPLFVGLLRIGF